MTKYIWDRVAASSKAACCRPVPTALAPPSPARDGHLASFIPVTPPSPQTHAPAAPAPGNATAEHASGAIWQCLSAHRVAPRHSATTRLLHAATQLSSRSLHTHGQSRRRWHMLCSMAGPGAPDAPSLGQWAGRATRNDGCSAEIIKCFSKRTRVEPPSKVCMHACMPLSVCSGRRHAWANPPVGTSTSATLTPGGQRRRRSAARLAPPRSARFAPVFAMRCCSEGHRPTWPCVGRH